MAGFAPLHQGHIPQTPEAPLPADTHFPNLQHRMADLHIDTNAPRLNTRPTYQTNIRSPHSGGQTRVEGGSQYFSLPSKPTTVPPSGSHQMYRFEKHKMPGREANWEMADRALITSKEADLTKRIKKPSSGSGIAHTRPHARDMGGFKQRQVDQLLRDIHYFHPELEAEIASIELHGIKLDGKTGRAGAAKMIVIVKRVPRNGRTMMPLATQHERHFRLKEELVNLRPFAPLPSGQSQWQPGVQHAFGTVQTPFVDPAYAHNIPPMHDPHQISTHEIHDHGHLNTHNHHDTHDHHDLDDFHDHGHHDHHSKPHSRSRSKAPKSSKTPKIVPVKISNNHHHSDSSSSSTDSDSFSDADTDATPPTLFTASSGSPESDKRFFSSDHHHKKTYHRSTNRVEPSREHRREDVLNSLNNKDSKDRSSASYSKSGTAIVQPASSRRHRHHRHRRDPSFERDRPDIHSKPRYEEDHHYPRRSEYSSPSSPSSHSAYSFSSSDWDHRDRRGSVYDRPRRITQPLDLRDALDIQTEERHRVEAENARLKREARGRERWGRGSDDGYVRVEHR